MTTVSELFQKAIKNCPAELLPELDLTNAKAENLVGLPETLPQLIIFSATELGLKSLEGLPEMARVVDINLVRNELDAEAIKIIASKTKQLEQLNLAGNQISSLQDLKPLQAIESLQILDLTLNPITKEKDYRSAVFKSIPQLVYLDSLDRDNKELPLEDDEAEDEDITDDEEELEAEDGDDDDDDAEDDEEEEEEEVGLSYLNTSACAADDDPAEYEAPAKKRKFETSAAPSGDAASSGDEAGAENEQ